MPRYLVERTFPDGLGLPINEAGARLCSTIIANNLQSGVTWVHSYVTPDRKKAVRVLDPYFVR